MLPRSDCVVPSSSRLPKAPALPGAAETRRGEACSQGGDYKRAVAKMCARCGALVHKYGIFVRIGTFRSRGLRCDQEDVGIQDAR